MAITVIEYGLFHQFREQNGLPLGGHLLELGEANWYGDVPLEQLRQDIRRFAAEAEQEALLRELDECDRARRPFMLWEIAKIWWRTFWRPASLTAIDFHGTEAALKQDLNAPLDLPRQYDAVFNLGTAEHVFDVAQVFRSIHAHTRPGGLMVHGLPFTGWIDHGFFGFHPTFYWDLAAANGYAVQACVLAQLAPPKLIQLARRESALELARQGQLGQNTLIYVMLKMPDQPAEFRIPMQGYYAGTVSAEAAQAWVDLR